MYLAETGERLPILDEAGKVQDNRVVLGRYEWWKGDRVSSPLLPGFKPVVANLFAGV